VACVRHTLVPIAPKMSLLRPVARTASRMRSSSQALISVRWNYRSTI